MSSFRILDSLLELPLSYFRKEIIFIEKEQIVSHHKLHENEVIII